MLSRPVAPDHVYDHSDLSPLQKRVTISVDGVSHNFNTQGVHCTSDGIIECVDFTLFQHEAPCCRRKPGRSDLDYICSFTLRDDGTYAGQTPCCEKSIVLDWLSPAAIEHAKMTIKLKSGNPSSIVLPRPAMKRLVDEEVFRHCPTEAPQQVQIWSPYHAGVHIFAYDNTKLKNDRIQISLTSNNQAERPCKCAYCLHDVHGENAIYTLFFSPSNRSTIEHAMLRCDGGSKQPVYVEQVI